MSRYQILPAGALTSLLLLAAPASQATSTDVVLNLEGNPTCSSLGDNSAVIEYRDSNPVGVKQVVLPTPAGTQTLAYEVVEAAGENARMVEWSIVEVNGSTDVANSPNVFPINYTILKAQGGQNGARVFHFGTSAKVPGAITDSDEEGPGGRMAAVSFCYGLTSGFNQPDPPSVVNLPNCDDLSQTPTGISDLYTTGIDCPETGEQQLIINLALNEDNFGFNFDTNTVRACTCNVDLPPCNPDLPAVPKGTQDENTPADERSCMEYDVNSDANNDGYPDGVNTRVPLQIMGVENPDSYICYVIGGTRYCYGHY